MRLKETDKPFRGFSVITGLKIIYCNTSAIFSQRADVDLQAILM